MTLTYAIYRNVPPLNVPAFARARDQGVIEQIDAVRTSVDGTKIWLKWRGSQPSELAPGLVLWTGDHSQALQKLIDDNDEWNPEP